MGVSLSCICLVDSNSTRNLRVTRNEELSTANHPAKFLQAETQRDVVRDSGSNNQNARTGFDVESILEFANDVLTGAYSFLDASGC
jgi:hypothetical protein